MHSLATQPPPGMYANFFNFGKLCGFVFVSYELVNLIANNLKKTQGHALVVDDTSLNATKAQLFFLISIKLKYIAQSSNLINDCCI